MKRYIFPDPLDARCSLQPDSMPGSPIVGVADTHPTNGAPCQSFDVPSTVPNKNGATLMIVKDGFVSVVLHGILDTVTAGGGGFESDVFRLHARFELTIPQPLTFDSNGGSGSFSVKTATGFEWGADEGATAEDWVVVAPGYIDGSGTKTFRVKSAAEMPQVPLPRSGYIEIYEKIGGTLVLLARVQIQQK
jgi:hypothetical protein